MWTPVFKFLGAPVYLIGMLWYLLVEVPFFQGKLKMFLFMANALGEGTNNNG